jgi:chromate transporter
MNVTKKSSIPGSDQGASVSLGHIFSTFLMAGAISFGGGVVAYLREYIVSDNNWLDDDGFLDGLEISQALPGLNSVNLSVIVGDKLRGIPGAIAAVLGMVLPGAIIIMMLGVIWGAQADNPNIKYFLIGVAAAAVGLLSTVTMQLGRKQFGKPIDLAIILVAFAAISLLRLPLYLVLVLIGPTAVWLYRPSVQDEGIRERAHHLRERLRHRHIMYIRQ